MGAPAFEAGAGRPSDSTSWDTVGILVFPGFEPLDAYGPLELFGSMIREGLRKVKRVVFVAETAGPVPCCFGPCTVAEYGLDDCPPLDVLVISGGIGTRILMHNTKVIQWLRKQVLDPKVQHILSVCTGGRRRNLLDVSRGEGMRWGTDASRRGMHRHPAGEQAHPLLACAHAMALHDVTWLCMFVYISSWTIPGLGRPFIG